MPDLLPDSLADLSALLPFSKVRLIAFDLDGTLIPHNLALRFQQLSRSIRKRDVRLVLATGRALSGVEPLLDYLLLRDALLILYNGSLVLERKGLAVAAHRRIELAGVRKVVAVAIQEGVRAFAYYFHGPVRGSTELFGRREIVVGWPGARVDDLPTSEFNGISVQWATEADLPDHPATAILIELDGDSVRTVRIRSQLEDISEVSITQSGSRYLEVRPAGSDKAVALEEVASALNVNRDHVLAVGDNDNDAEMLAWAGIGVAVDRASSMAVAKSNYVCRRGTFSGVIEMLRIVRDAKRFFP